MKKFVRYLYVYQNGKRVRNVGFVKYEEADGRAILQIYGKGFPPQADEMYELFVFYVEEGQCIGVSMGTLKSTSPVFSYRLEYDEKDMGGKDFFDKVEGVILVYGQEMPKGFYAAQWCEQFRDIEHMRRKEEVLLEEVAVEEVPAEEEIVIEDADLGEESAKELSVEEKEAICALEQEHVREKDVIFKITRQDMAKLPRCEWKLANNHFLLHGYYNYHHLVSFEKEGICWLGVPGIFHPKEQKVAKAFGFEQFMRPDEGEIELTAEQREDNEEFGYWCRSVSAVIGE